MKSRLEQKLLQKALNVKFDAVENDPLSDLVIDSIASSDVAPAKLKNLCAYVTPAFAEALEQKINFLGMSKREFITLAISEAMLMADRIIEEVDVFEYADNSKIAVKLTPSTDQAA